MKTIIFSFAFLAFVLAAVSAFAVTPENPRMVLKAGDEVYACGCGPACPCKTLSMQPGKCSCGVPLVKSTVMKMEGDVAVINVNGKDENFPLVGKYVCPCGPDCPCDTISQTPGKCACGKDLVPAK
jgi:hypothetical protein